MSETHSDRARPPGTVVRDWRLEEVLAIGRRGIVYRGRGAHSGERAAIKEYFPTSIGEREPSGNIVPVGDQTAEAYARGLRAFLEDAKLLTNLSKPARHPNIVNVRACFEAQGTAYMVMDLEEGVPLSQLLEEGRRFGEQDLLNLVQPIARGLDRAHRVGVLHRDIKPSNILVSPDGHPVLIDFASARFEPADVTTGEARPETSPYSAIEQYQDTYEQGPWTDIYALGVLLYECVARQKPPSAPERLERGQGKPLGDGEWPGYSQRFLAAVDAAMAIRPSDRPRSIGAWLELFEGGSVRTSAAADQSTLLKAEQPQHKMGTVTESAKDPGEAAAPKREAGASPTGKPLQPSQSRPLLLGAGVLVLLATAGGSWMVLDQDAGERAPDISIPMTTAKRPVRPVAMPAPNLAPLASELDRLVDDARAAGVPPSVLNPLAEASAEVAKRSQNRNTSALEGAGSGDAIRASAGHAGRGFADALLRQSEARARRLGESVPWTDPLRTRSRTTLTAEQQAIARRLKAELFGLRAAAAGAAASTNPAETLVAAHQAVGRWKAFAAAVAAAERQNIVAVRSEKTSGTDAPRIRNTAPPAPASPSYSAIDRTPTIGVSPAQVSELESIISDGRGMAKRVMRARPRGDAAKGYAQLARNYDQYLIALRASMRGVKSAAQADRMIAQARRTRAYLVYLVQKSDSAR